jgi:hypothetical protein
MLDPHEAVTLVTCPCCTGFGWTSWRLVFGSPRLDEYGERELEMCRLCNWRGMVKAEEAVFWKRAQLDHRDNHHQ